ncbi:MULTISPECIES: electron transporter [Cyanophyceae]|uniref:cyclic electron transport protein PGR5 n=2 Tax=Cyanobacteriota TaxID=1117 RepID=UPI0020CB047D|nr:electron transporter [Picosynechococcus sp. PCC 7002]
MGTARFNKTRGKVIGLHCKTITNFCNTVGLDAKTRQNLIRLAKSNGHRLGFMA